MYDPGPTIPGSTQYRVTHHLILLTSKLHVPVIQLGSRAATVTAHRQARAVHFTNVSIKDSPLLGHPVQRREDRKWGSVDSGSRTPTPRKIKNVLPARGPRPSLFNKQRRTFKIQILTPRDKARVEVSLLKVRVGAA